MEMTIDYCINYFESTIDELAKEGQYCEVFEMVVDTMRKYQKITEIVKSWRENGLDYDSCDAMDNIKRVIEDGKID